jgi:hypothetical protein
MPVGKTQILLILVLNARQVLRYKSSELILRSPWPEQDGLILALVLITRTHYGGSMQMIKKKGSWRSFAELNYVLRSSKSPPSYENAS